MLRKLIDIRASQDATNGRYTIVIPSLLACSDRKIQPYRRGWLLSDADETVVPGRNGVDEDC
jgi:hypothetical protein